MTPNPTTSNRFTPTYSLDWIASRRCSSTSELPRYPDDRQARWAWAATVAKPRLGQLPPPTDWRNYDTIYTERYLGLPQENEKGYVDGSAVTYAGNLKGKLLLIHCFGDDNVLFQNSFQMLSALQKSGKQFELMMYPDKSHGVGGQLQPHLSTAITNFFERTLKN